MLAHIEVNSDGSYTLSFTQESSPAFRNFRVRRNDEFQWIVQDEFQATVGLPSSELLTVLTDVMMQAETDAESWGL